MKKMCDKKYASAFGRLLYTLGWNTFKIANFLLLLEFYLNFILRFWKYRYKNVMFYIDDIKAIELLIEDVYFCSSY